jgi:hypothetical protein
VTKYPGRISQRAAAAEQPGSRRRIPLAFAAIAASRPLWALAGQLQEERWKTDEAAIKGQLAKIGGSYVSADAGGSPEQLADIDGPLPRRQRR